MGGDSTSAGAQGGFHPGHSPWAIALTVTLATFMEVLDTTIVNVALPHIAGGLAATQEEATWVLTSYLVSNAIVLPVSGWLALRVGRKRFYMSCVALFTISSFLCGIAPSLGLLIFFRVLQGAGGGGLAPSEQSILADTFAPAMRGIAFGIYGMAVVVAPAIGPTLGGYITDGTGWRWIFFLNVPVGVLSLLLTKRMVSDPPHLVETRRRPQPPIDYFGLALVAAGFGTLQVVLDKGQEEDWFGSSFIRWFAFISAASLLGMVVRELRSPHPMIELRLLAKRNFGLSCLLIGLVGTVLFGSTVLLPQFEQTLLGYTAEKAGETLSIGGLVILPLMPLVGRILQWVSPRWLVALGFAMTGYALHVMTQINPDISFAVATRWRVLQALGLAFLFIPITASSYVGVPRDKYEHASALLNLFRNLGGSVGISLMEALLVQRAQVHQVSLVSHVTQFSGALREAVTRQTAALEQAGVNAVVSTRMVYARIYAAVQQQAVAMAYEDAFWLLAVLAAFAVPVALLLRRDPHGSGQVPVH